MPKEPNVCRVSIPKMAGTFRFWIISRRTLCLTTCPISMLMTISPKQTDHLSVSINNNAGEGRTIDEINTSLHNASGHFAENSKLNMADDSVRKPKKERVWTETELSWMGFHWSCFFGYVVFNFGQNELKCIPRNP